MTRSKREAECACKSLDAGQSPGGVSVSPPNSSAQPLPPPRLLTADEFSKLLLAQLANDAEGCFSNLGLTATDRGCNPPQEPVTGLEEDKTASNAYTSVARFQNLLGLRNLLGNAWEWTADGGLMGGATNTILPSGQRRGQTTNGNPDLEFVKRHLMRPSGEGAIRCVIRYP